jgi:hypothetical protein
VEHPGSVERTGPRAAGRSQIRLRSPA